MAKKAVEINSTSNVAEVAMAFITNNLNHNYKGTRF